MDAVLDLIRSVSTIIFFSLKDITEEDVEKNLEYLKHNKWFQDFLDDEEYSKLILNNTDVRKVIGSIDTKKMSKPKYNKNQQKRLKRELEKQLDNKH
ncbi:hypothetical protein [Oceanobacillus manasiensis]|uniref:hypothetical protein n=1 Tax=Oceanobacillus manasiensis TaxID=586413 RepID=UPI0005A8ADB4|nr:hypothetical protein [Oceanobacillus manasiensis]